MISATAPAAATPACMARVADGHGAPSFYLGKKVAFVYKGQRETRGTKHRVVCGIPLRRAMHSGRRPCPAHWARRVGLTLLARSGARSREYTATRASCGRVSSTPSRPSRLAHLSE